MCCGTPFYSTRTLRAHSTAFPKAKKKNRRKFYLSLRPPSRERAFAGCLCSVSTRAFRFEQSQSPMLAAVGHCCPAGIASTLGTLTHARIHTRTVGRFATRPLHCTQLTNKRPYWLRTNNRHTSRVCVHQKERASGQTTALGTEANANAYCSGERIEWNCAK